MRAAWKAAGIVAVPIGLAVSARLLDRAGGGATGDGGASVPRGSDVAEDAVEVGCDRRNNRMQLFSRTLTEVGGFGRVGHYAGEFVFLHAVATDSTGDVYTAEVGGGRRVQKFVRQRSR